MTEKLLAVYERKSTLWKNANYFYVLHDWVKMECTVVDYTEDIAWYNCAERKVTFHDMNGNDVTEQELERRYGKPYHVTFTNKRGNNSETHSFKTREEANSFVKSVLTNKVLKNFKRVQ